MKPDTTAVIPAIDQAIKSTNNITDLMDNAEFKDFTRILVESFLTIERKLLAGEMTFAIAHELYTDIKWCFGDDMNYYLQFIRDIIWAVHVIDLFMDNHSCLSSIYDNGKEWYDDDENYDDYLYPADPNAAEVNRQRDLRWIDSAKTNAHLAAFFV